MKPAKTNLSSACQKCMATMAAIATLALFGLSPTANICRGQNVTVGNLTVTGFANITNGLAVSNLSTYYSYAGGQIPFYIPGMFYYNDTNGTYNMLTTSSWAFVPNALDSVGPNFAFGTWSNGTANFNGADLNIHDNGDDTSSNITFLGTSPNVTWSWLETSGNAVMQMKLDNRGNLTINDTFTSNYISFSPGNLTFILGENGTAYDTMSLWNYASGAGAAITYVSSGGAYPIVFNGNNSAAPLINLGNVSFQGNSSTDTLVINNGGNSSTTIDPNLQTLTFTNGFAINYNYYTAQISLGNNAFVLGQNVSTAGSGTFAMGYGTSAGYSPDAVIGYGAYAGYIGDVSIGYEAATSENTSVAIGNNAFTLHYATAGGDSVAIGQYTIAYIWGEEAVGHNNGWGSPNTSWGATNSAFFIGVGNSTTAANALAILNNGNATISNLTTVSQSVAVDGATMFNGTTTFSGNVYFNQPWGSFPMGGFGN